MLMMSGMAFGQTQTANITVNVDGATYNVVASSEMYNALTGYTQGQQDIAGTGVYDILKTQGPGEWRPNTLLFLPGYTNGRYTVQHFISGEYHLYDGNTYIDAYDYSPIGAICQRGYLSHQAVQMQILEIIRSRP